MIEKLSDIWLKITRGFSPEGFYSLVYKKKVYQYHLFYVSLILKVHINITENWGDSARMDLMDFYLDKSFA